MKDTATLTLFSALISISTLSSYFLIRELGFLVGLSILGLVFVSTFVMTMTMEE